MKNLTENKPTKQILILKESVNLIRVSTTSNEEEDFLLLTDLNDQEIKDIITPIVEKERESEDFDDEENPDFYDNEGLVWALKDHYPNNLVIHYTLDGIDSLTI
jgi:hypothetical protein